MFSDCFYSNFLEPSVVDNAASDEYLHIDDVVSDISSIEIQELEVYKLLKGVDLNKSAGPG